MKLVPINKKESKIIIIDDDEQFSKLVSRHLTKHGYSITPLFDATSAKKELTKNKPDIVLLDLTLPPLGTVVEGLNLFKFIKKELPEVEVIILSGTGQKEDVLGCIKDGAYDYIEKTSEDIKQKIEIVCERALQLIAYGKEIINQQNKMIKGLGGLVGQSNKMQKVYKLIKEYADTDENIILLGETGTGKNVTARAIHDLTQRSKQQFLYLNCSTLTSNLLESELFGYEKGAFSGAEKTKIGLFEAADKGTLFLDEIGEISPEMQAKLLDTIETKSFRRIGGVKNIKVDVRIISATNQDIEKLIDEKKFRLDLYQRMNILSITLPPLRERKDDIQMLGEHLFNLRNNGKCKWISEKCFKLLEKYSFPGNVREYDNLIKEIIIKTPKNHIIKPGILKTVLKNRTKNKNVIIESSFKPLKEVVGEYEMSYINEVIDYCNGSKSQAAKILSISHQGLNKKIKKEL